MLRRSTAAIALAIMLTSFISFIALTFHVDNYEGVVGTLRFAKPSPIKIVRKRTAVLLAIHKLEKYVWIRIRELANDLLQGGNVHVVVLYDADSSSPASRGDIARIEKLGCKFAWLDRKEIKAAYSSQVYDTFTQPYLSPDKIGSVLWAHRHVDLYTTFWFLEADVGFSGNWSVLISAHENSGEDLTVPRVNDVLRKKTWQWFKSCNVDVCKGKSQTQIFWPIGRCSDRFVRLLHTTLARGIVAMHEAFAGSLCAATPGCILGKFGTRWVDARQAIEGGTFRVKYKGDEEGVSRRDVWKNMLYHPSKPDFFAITETRAVDAFPLKISRVNTGSRIPCSEDHIHECVDAGMCWAADDTAGNAVHCLPSALIFDLSWPSVTGSSSKLYDGLMNLGMNIDCRLKGCAPSSYFHCLNGITSTRMLRSKGNSMCAERNVGWEKFWRHNPECVRSETLRARKDKAITNTVLSTWFEYAAKRERKLFERNRPFIIDRIATSFESVVPRSVAMLLPSVKSIFILPPPWEWAVAEWFRKCHTLCANRDSNYCTLTRYEDQLQGRASKNDRGRYTARELLREANFARYLQKWFSEFPGNSVAVFITGANESGNLKDLAHRIGHFVNYDTLPKVTDKGNVGSMGFNVGAEYPKYAALSIESKQKLKRALYPVVDALQKVLGESNAKVFGDVSFWKDEKLAQQPKTNPTQWLLDLKAGMYALKGLSDITDRLAAPQCKHFYSSSVPRSQGDDASEVYVGNRFTYEVGGLGGRHPKATRMFTFEDTIVAAPSSESPRYPTKRGSSPFVLSDKKVVDTWDIPVFLRTASRACSAAVLAKGQSEREGTTSLAVYVPIWKSASTAVTTMLHALPGKWKGPHGKSHRSWPDLSGKASCSRYGAASSTMIARLMAQSMSNETLARNIFRGDTCIEDGTFLIPPSLPSYIFTYVRDPVSRFLSGIQPHIKWSKADICGNEPCAKAKQIILKHVDRNLKSFHVSIGRLDVGRRLPHWLTQSYFLSATDAKGTPLLFDDVRRVEDSAGRGGALHLPVRIAGSKVSARIPIAKRNAGGSEDVKRVLRTWALRQTEIMCPFCRVYAQDFVCLGYEVPSVCWSCGDE